MESLVSNTICVVGKTLSDREELFSTFYSADDPNSAFDGRKANKSGLQNRRGALRKAKVHDFRGHEFLAKFFRQPVFCSVCMEFCWYVKIYLILAFNFSFDLSFFHNVCKYLIAHSSIVFAH